ncbi:MAG: AMP-binding protein, partial [Clostridia bacterium]|nr:AMP-binding protein [Clostridia bacterium]
MNLSFSTRGWQSFSFEENIKTATEMEFGGIEIYNVQKCPSLTDRGGAFHKYNTAATVRLLREKKLRIPCFDSSCDISADNCLDEARELMRIASDAQTENISVVALSENFDNIYSNLETLIPEAEKLKITILIKTSGVFCDTAKLRELLESFASDNLAALWDMTHTYFDNKESADTTIKNLGAYVRHAHLRDSLDGDNYTLIGEGTLPIAEMMQALGSVDYDGFISAEWKPEWMEEIDDREIIFPYFVNYMNRFDSPRGKKKTLYDNKTHTGQFVWKKDELISETFPQVLDRMVEEFPDQYAFKYTTLDYTRTYSEFRDDVDNFARALISLGVKRGSKVAIWATNVPAWYITFWATTKIGAVLVTVNTAYKIHEAEYLLRQSDTHTLVMIENCLDSDYRGIINELCPELKDTKPGQPLHCKKLPFLRNVITVGYKEKGCLEFDEAMDRADMVPLEQVHRMASQVRSD